MWGNVYPLMQQHYFPEKMKSSMKILILFDVRKSVHHHAIQINQPTRCNSFTSLLCDVYVWVNIFWALPRPIIRSLQLH
jgi:hypothetical protein